MRASAAKHAKQRVDNHGQGYVALHGAGVRFVLVADAESQLQARDIASSAGIARTVHTQGENCVFDYNRDGVKDLFLSNHADGPWQLFRGTSDGNVHRDERRDVPRP